MDILINEDISYKFIEKVREQFFYIDCRENNLSEYPK